MENGLTIAKLARAADVGVETVRFYQRRGLMPAPPPVEGSVRRYDADDVRRLRFVRRAQAAGFSLDEIGELLMLDRHTDRARARALATERLVQLDARIAALQSARTALTRIAEACAKDDCGPCPIIESFDEAHA
jgi:MerR family mercuric resistance operon transcriptional regulator